MAISNSRKNIMQGPSPIAERALLVALAFLLFLYAIAGKGAAYVGWYPIFLSEILTISGGLLCLAHLRHFILPPAAVHLLMALFALCSLRLFSNAPHLSMAGLRDFMLVGYAVIAFSVWCAGRKYPFELSVPGHFRTFSKAFCILSPPSIILANMFPDALWTFPDSPVPILAPKPGDTLVILGFIIAALTLGVIPKLSLIWYFPLAMVAGIMASLNRGGIVSLSFAIGLSLAFSLNIRPVLRLACCALVLGLLAMAFNLKMDSEITTHRTISAYQLGENLESLLGMTSDKTSKDNVNWRLTWWSDICAYSIGGEYTLHGKGFGVNLATDDGHQVLADHSLRSPHNATLNILARTGIPGLFLWLTFHSCWLLQLLFASRRFIAVNDFTRARLSRLCMVAVVTTLVNSSFDVYLEGPMGAIWHWAWIGLGLVLIHRAAETGRLPATVLAPGNARNATAGFE